MISSRPPEPDYEAVEGAEIMLSMIVKQWSTDVVLDLLGCKAAGGVNPDRVPMPGRMSYAVLWWHMGARYATDTLKRMLRPVAAGRVFTWRRGPCPGCGAPDADILEYDDGYFVATHGGPLADLDIQGAARGLVNLKRQCRAVAP